MAAMDGPKTPCTWALTDMDRLRRFLCLGAETGAYRCVDIDPSKSRVECILSLLEAGKGKEVIEEIKKCSAEGRLAKQEPLIFTLAMVAKKSKDMETKQAAFAVVADICRIPTHLFQFVKFCEEVCDTTGWGRGQRNAIARWYNSKDPRTLALHVTKYRQRLGWSHRDLFRLCHLKPKTEATTLIVKYVIQGLEKARASYTDAESLANDVQDVLKYLDVVETVKHSQDEEQVARLIEEHKLVREQIPTWMMKSKKVWNALLPCMPAEALIRSLSRMAALKMLTADAEENCIQAVLERLRDTETLHKARVHPLTLLSALTAYKKGGGEGSEKAKKPKWDTDSDVEKALEEAFYNSFKVMVPTGQRFLIALDVSATLQYGHVTGCPGLSPGDAAVAMAMGAVRTEEVCDLVTFSTCGVETLAVTKDTRLEDLRTQVSERRKGGTDCSRPMLWAQEEKKAYDMFLVYTDMAAYLKETHPADALRQYRDALGLPKARLLICSLTASDFTVADPEDAGMLDIAGFDSGVPLVIHNFAKGEL